MPPEQVVGMARNGWTASIGITGRHGPDYAFLGSFAVSDAPITSTLEYRPTPAQRERNRRAMLRMVGDFWVKGVLEQSLHGVAMIELGLEKRADAVEHPWDMVLQTEREDRTLPRGTRIMDVFDEMRGSLLILGEPGSGKTTMLLELARDTIARAEQDPAQPIPVVLNLSSWAEKKQTTAKWLVEELNIKYNIPKRVARPWVENDDLLLLLDGLDEVKREYQEDCVGAINDFRKEHLVPLVVCSRVADYQALTTRLRLQGAVILQPLTPQQIDRYLGSVGAELLAVREMLQHDLPMQELAQTPLMLDTMAVAYRGMSVEDLRTFDSTEKRCKHVFDTYVQRAFAHRGCSQRYSKEHAIRWLAWLARKMSQHAQAIFLIEQLQPIWLETGAQRRIYAIVFFLTGFLLVYTPIGGLGLGLGILPPSVCLIGVLGIVLMYALPVAFAGVVDVTHLNVEPVEVLTWSWKEGGKGFIRGLRFGLKNIVTVLSCGLIFGLFLGMRSGSTAGLMTWLMFGVLGGLSDGFGSAAIQDKAVPNQGIRRSATNALLIGLGIWLIVGPMAGLILEYVVGTIPSLGPPVWLFVGLILGQILGSVSGLVLGGLACILHYTLRLALWFSGCIPLDLARFLDFAAERIFLRKVGGGYIFINPILQDYFASLCQGE